MTGTPSLMLVQAKDEAAARNLATRMLAEKHHHNVEVWRGDARLFSLGDPVEGATARRASA